jgi:hypothetical protein
MKSQNSKLKSQENPNEHRSRDRGIFWEFANWNLEINWRLEFGIWNFSS